MVTKSIFGALAAAVILNAGVALAEVKMEKCKVVDKNGKGLIKEHKSDCKGDGHSCAGQNKAWDASSWINVPDGMCAKINDAVAKGDKDALKSMPTDVTDKLDMSMMR